MSTFLESLIVQQEGEILLIKINRPQKRNAINDALILEIEQVFSNIPTGIKTAIISGQGEHFSAGLDLSELKERTLPVALAHSRMWHRALEKIQFGTIPVIAVLHGACVGGGLEIAAACHIRVAEKNTFYALPEGQRGIFVGGGASVRLPKLIGIANMTDMMLTGRIISAQEGEKIGMAQYLVENNQGLEKAKELAQKIARNSEMTNYAVMHVLPKIADSSHTEGLLMESLMAAIASNSPDAQSRLKEFLDGKAEKLKFK
jgi:(methylthio)acryloyl-CoA hydratase